MEFTNQEFKTFCENLNVRICTAAAESPQSNGLVERHNAVRCKTKDKTNCDLDVTIAWAVSAKNYLKNVYDFSPNQLVFEKKNVSNVSSYVSGDLLPALENKTTSQTVNVNVNGRI